MGIFKKFCEFENSTNNEKSYNSKMPEAIHKFDASLSKEQFLKFSDFTSSPLCHLQSIDQFNESSKIKHMVDELDNDDLEEELPTANSYSDAEVGSILTKDLIDDDTMFEVMDRVGEKGVIYTEVSKYYWQVRGDNLVRIA